MLIRSSDLRPRGTCLRARTGGAVSLCSGDTISVSICRSIPDSSLTRPIWRAPFPIRRSSSVTSACRSSGAWHGEAAALYWRQLRDGGYRALEELRNAGAAGAIGLGVNETESVLEATKEFQLDCALIAGRYTLLNHAPLNGAFAELQRRNVSVIAAGVFNSGVLAAGARAAAPAYDYRIAPSDVVERVRRVEAICDRHRVALPAAAVQFVYAHPAVSVVLLGAENPAEVEHDLAAVSVRIPEAFWSKLKQEGIIPEAAPTIPLERSDVSGEPSSSRP